MQPYEGTISPIHVLVVDDNLDDIVLLRRLFEKITDAQFVVDVVSDYHAALESVAKAKFDICLVDYKLGEHTGLELLHEAHSSERPAPFIFVVQAQDRLTVLESSPLATGILIKGSFDSEMLAKTVLFALRRTAMEESRLDELRKLNESKDEFISIASHQLRTPATGVKQYIGMLREGFFGPVPESQRQILEKAYESNERQLDIINDLLRVAQVDAGKVTPSLDNVDLNDFLVSIVRDFTQTFQEHGQKIDLQTLDHPAVVYTDGVTVRMVIENLIDNAGKYSHKDTVFHISLNETDKYFLVNVSDEGVGIVSRERPRLFGKFARIDNELSTRVGGSGLGLYWAKKVMELGGGDVIYKPRRLRGSVFTVKIPKKTALEKM